MSLYVCARTHIYVCDDLNVCKAKITCHCFWNLEEWAQKQEHSNTHIFAFCGLNPIQEDKKAFHFWIPSTTFCLRLNIWGREGWNTRMTHTPEKKEMKTNANSRNLLMVGLQSHTPTILLSLRHLAVLWVIAVFCLNFSKQEHRCQFNIQ